MKQAVQSDASQVQKTSEPTRSRPAQNQFAAPGGHLAQLAAVINGSPRMQALARMKEDIQRTAQLKIGIAGTLAQGDREAGLDDAMENHESSAAESPSACGCSSKPGAAEITRKKSPAQKKSKSEGSAIVQLLKDDDQVPVWVPDKGTTESRAASSLPGEELLAVIRPKFGSVRMSKLKRTETPDLTPDGLKDNKGQPILAFVLNEADAAACVKAMSAQTALEGPSLLGSNKQRGALTATLGAGALASIGKMGAQMSRQMQAHEGAVLTQPESRPKNPIELLAKLQRNWFNCGQVGVNILQELKGAGAKLDVVEEHNLRPNDIDVLGRILTRSAKHLIVDCSFLSIHTFTVELLPDGRCYLVQGYEKKYSAFWWQQFPTRPQDVALKPEASKDEMEAAEKSFELAELRKRYGSPEGFDEEDLAELQANIQAFVKSGYKVAEWKKLPFLPSEDPSLLSHAAKDIQLKVRVLEVKDASDVYQRLGGKAPQSLCVLAVKGVNELYEQTKLRAGESTETVTSTNVEPSPKASARTTRPKDFAFAKDGTPYATNTEGIRDSGQCLWDTLRRSVANQFLEAAAAECKLKIDQAVYDDELAKLINAINRHAGTSFNLEVDYLDIMSLEYVKTKNYGGGDTRIKIGLFYDPDKGLGHYVPPSK